jgi:hypothetical protein
LPAALRLPGASFGLQLDPIFFNYRDAIEILAQDTSRQQSTQAATDDDSVLAIICLDSGHFSSPLVSYWRSSMCLLR